MDKIAQKALKTKNMKEVEKAGREFIMGKLSIHHVFFKLLDVAIKNRPASD